MKRRHSFLILLCFSITVTALFLLVIDFGLGLVFNSDQAGIFHPYYHHGLRPLYVAPQRWGPAQLSFATNSLSFRDTSARQVPLENKTPRLLFIGDSFTYGYGVSYEKSFVGRIAERMKPDGVEVLDAAVSSYSPKLEYLKIRYLIEKVHLHFDALIVFIDLSDIQDEIEYAAFEPRNHLTFVQWTDLFLRRRSYLWGQFYTPMHHAIRYVLLMARSFFHHGSLTSGMEDVRKTSTFYRDLYGKPYLWIYDPALYETWGKKGLGSAVGYIDRLADLCEQNHIPLAIGIYPWKEDMLRGAVQNHYTEAWEALAMRRDIPLINLFPTFIKQGDPKQKIQDDFISGDIHWNANGHALVAQAVMQSGVIQHLLARKEKTQ